MDDVSGSHWLRSLKINDKVDVKGAGYGAYWWIGTVIKINDNRIFVRFCGTRTNFYYDYYGDTRSNEKVININKWDTFDELKHPKLRKLHSESAYHDDEDNIKCSLESWSIDHQICTVCHRTCCNQCFLINIKTSQGLQYQCKDCVFSKRVNVLFLVCKHLYDTIYKSNIIELSIIHLIKNYCMQYMVKCCREIGECDQYISFNTQIEKKRMKYDISTQYMNEAILCGGCGFMKRNQTRKIGGLCVIYHDYMRYKIKCNGMAGCDKILCNGCVDRKVYDLCLKCNKNLCYECSNEMKKKCLLKCNECKSICCSQCSDKYSSDQVFEICNKCNDKLCPQCIPCSCLYSNINKLKYNDLFANNSTDQDDAMINVD